MPNREIKFRGVGGGETMKSSKEEFGILMRAVGVVFLILISVYLLGIISGLVIKIFMLGYNL